LKPGEAEDPFAWAMNILAPFSNRVSVPIVVDGIPVPLAPNLSGEAFPIHGNAFQRPWRVSGLAPDTVCLDLPDGAFGPLRYAARLTYALRAERLEARLVLRNKASVPLPFGGGFHPWFPRDSDTLIAFSATGYWPEDARHLPATRYPVELRRHLSFEQPRPLSDGWINAGFSGWAGTATILQGKHAHSARLAGKGLSTLLLYSPGRAADFFCLEPVSHPVDAYALPGCPGLRILAPGEEMTLGMTLEWNIDDA
jgi:aldose 1-epimerase